MHRAQRREAQLGGRGGNGLGIPLRCAFLLLLLPVTLLGLVREVSVDSDEALERTLEAIPGWREAGEAVEVVLEPGTYRVPLRLSGPELPDHDEPPRLLVIRARIPGSVHFTEGLELNEWQTESFRIWSHALPDPVTEAAPLRLFYDGAWLKQATARATMNPWEFLVVPREGLLLVAIPDSAPVRFEDFRLAARKPGTLLLLQRMQNVVLEGLVFSYDFPGPGVQLFESPHIVSSSDIELRNCRFLWNQRGLRILDSSQVRLLDCHFQFNGEQGLAVTRGSAVEIRGAVISHNGRLEPQAQPEFAFGHALVLEDLQGPTLVARSRIHDNTSGLLVREGRGQSLRLQHLVIGHHRGFGLVLSGTSAVVEGSGLRIGRNGGPGLWIDATGYADSPPVRLHDCIFFEVDGDTVIEVRKGRLRLRESIVESRSAGGWLLRMGSESEFRGRGNLYFHREGQKKVFNGKGFDRWRLDPEREEGSRFADPQFLNTETLDFDMDFSSPWFQR